LCDKFKRWARHVASVGREKSAYWVLVEKPEGNGPFGTPMNICKNNIKMDFQ
jgi:hypothetical protein